MGHYEDIIEEREDAEFEARAKRLGVSRATLVAVDIHREKMEYGRKLYDKKQAEEEAIEYYLQNRK